jgi:hypothetical protein
MDKIAIEQMAFPAPDHVKRTDVAVFFAVSYVRENPDIEKTTIDMDPREWAMAAFILCLGAMRPDDGGFASGGAIAAMWGISNGCSNQQITRATDWALEQITTYELKKRGLQ